MGTALLAYTVIHLHGKLGSLVGSLVLGLCRLIHKLQPWRWQEHVSQRNRTHFFS